MAQSLATFLLILIAFPIYSQWNVKNLDEKADYETIHKIKFYNDSLGYAMGTRGLILRTDDIGESWNIIDAGIDGNILDFDFNSVGEIILTTQLEQGTYKSSNGLDFKPVFQSEWDFPNVEFCKNGNFFLSGAEIIYLSQDQGETWDPVFDLKQNGYRWAHIKDFAIVTDDISYAVGDGIDEFDNTLYKSFLLKSIDSGKTWEIFNEYASGNFNVVNFSDELTGYILDGDRTLKTTNGGLTWDHLMAMYGAVDIAILNEKKLLTVNRPGAYNGDATSTVFMINESIDGGLTWINPEFGKGAHLETIYFLNDSVGFVAGDYSLILKTNNCGGEIGDDYPWHIFTTATKQLQNQITSYFPNPATTSLNFEMVTSQAYNYTIYNLNGKEICTGKLIQNSIDISEMAKGIYLVKLEGLNSSSVIKFIKQ